MIVTLLVALLGQAALSSEPATGISPTATAFNVAVHEAFLKVRAEQARSSPTTDRERLERLVDLDQAGRSVLAEAGLETLSESDRRVAQVGMNEITAQDFADQTQLRSMIPPSGWFTRRAYGHKAALGAWLVADHAVNDPALMRTVLARLKPLSSGGGFEGRQYAIMFDRVALQFDHRAQRYGTQVTCRRGAWVASDVETPDKLDRRRRAVGFEQSEGDYLRGFPDRCD